ncbi:50S ribosomal protein L25/general stress protein Ctc [Vagococcus xieshaowenii]|uniref:Large ribosomal subunit protein bL25 n=1 Tax=Vagococcus xieshaowenii TaxID=2562451 RepID=A0AAJ5EH56_9ENTE|nr:50S ribosomal protein L25/general stress protein Ctc [Vagococcus xieshaowenii]QCA29234.1 50S ribosomal protein L25/general stress protein Ctc [Vagococcus xieshaowenii]TFZ43253.1 50S ribosomal protein L25/general stress protein Ctc [Vagococcus xieshaowenii]
MEALLKVEERALRPRSIKRSIRLEGAIPAVVYGKMMESEAISVDGKDFIKLVRDNGINAVYYLEIDGKKIPTLIRGVQKDTFTQTIYHIEFLAVDMKEAQEVEAEIVLVGTPEGVKKGGVLTQDLFTVRVSAMPDKLPDTIEVDVSNLEIGQSIVLSDLAIKGEFDLLGDLEDQIASVSEARVEEEIDAEEAVTE